VKTSPKNTNTKRLKSGNSKGRKKPWVIDRCRSCRAA
jgi:hypothetical protein